jgi:hypothetical protein
MPYTLNDFPIETNEPKIEITLPPGSHVFELVVEDSAGLKSLPDRVTVVVQKELVPQPTITGIRPRFGVRGETGEATISGMNLFAPYEVKFLQDDQATAGVEASILAGGTDTTLRVVIVVKPTAALGSYGFAISARGGTTKSPPAVTFSVMAMPVIREFKPMSSERGEDTRLIIKGEYLRIEGEPLTAHRLEFLREGKPDPDILIGISEEGSGPEELVAHVRVKRTAAPGARILRITTPAGSAESPSSMAFLVTERS